MDMWSAFEKRSVENSFGNERFAMFNGERQHTSLSMIIDNAYPLNLNQGAVRRLDKTGPRYVMCKDVGFDLLITLYDVSTRQAAVFRILDHLDALAISALKKFVSKLKDPTLELRAIGMQNGNASAFRSIDVVKKLTRAQLKEADLFGNQLRHIALDLKTGQTYNVLLLDRIYRPGETTYAAKFEDLKSNLLKFVLV